MVCRTAGGIRSCLETTHCLGTHCYSGRCKSSPGSASTQSCTIYNDKVACGCSVTCHVVLACPWYPCSLVHHPCGCDKAKLRQNMLPLAPETPNQSAPQQPTVTCCVCCNPLLNSLLSEHGALYQQHWVLPQEHRSVLEPSHAVLCTDSLWPLHSPAEYQGQAQPPKSDALTCPCSTAGRPGAVPAAAVPPAAPSPAHSAAQQAARQEHWQGPPEHHPHQQHQVQGRQWQWMLPSRAASGCA